MTTLRSPGSLVLPAFGLMMLAFSAPSAAQETPSPHNEFVGLVFVSPSDSLCLSIRNAQLLPGTEIAVVDSTNRGRLWEATIEGRSDGVQCATEIPGLPGASYSLGVESGVVPSGIYFGVIGGLGRFSVEGARVVAQFDRRVPADEFEVCLSNEGIHFTIWNGPMSQGARIWHRYHYLGYDVEADCTEAEFAEGA